MKLSEWCKQKMEDAKDGEEAYAYHQLMEMWQRREVDDAGKPVADSGRVEQVIGQEDKNKGGRVCTIG